MIMAFNRHFQRHPKYIRRMNAIKIRIKSAMLWPKIGFTFTIVTSGHDTACSNLSVVETCVAIPLHFTQALLEKL